MLRSRLLPVVVLVVTAAVVASVTVLPRAVRLAGTPTPYCTVLQVLFGSDEALRGAAEALRADPRVREVRDVRTKAENHERLTAMLRESGHDEMADASLVAATPASLRVVEAFGVDAVALAGDLRREHHRVNHVDVCAQPEGLSDIG